HPQCGSQATPPQGRPSHDRLRPRLKGADHARPSSPVRIGAGTDSAPRGREASRQEASARLTRQHQGLPGSNPRRPLLHRGEVPLLMRSETFSTPGGVRLNLEIPSGEIELETAQTDETHVELEAVSNDDAVRDLVANARIELIRRGDGHEVVVEAKGRRGI